MRQSDSHVSKHHWGQILTEAGKLNPKAITKCQPRLITSFETNVNMSNYNSSCVCVSRWEYGFVQSFGIILRPQLVTYGVENDMCVQDLISFYFTKKKCNLHFKKYTFFSG
jgi:hypothetical protein